MPNDNIQLTLTGFHFPRELPNNKANFRFLVDVRHANKKGEFATEHAVMPSMDTFWECDKSRKDKPNFVRGQDVENFGTFNMNKIDDWDRLILLLRGAKLHSIQFKVFDVNRIDAWDKIKDVVGAIVQALIGKLKGMIPGLPALPGVSDSLGSAVDDLESWLIKKLSGGGDKILFRGSKTLKGNGNPSYVIQGNGSRGEYKITFKVESVL